MGFTSDFFRAYVDMMEDAGFIEGFIIFVLFGISLSVVAALLFAAVVVLIFGFCSWWADAGDAAAAAEEPAAMEVPVVGEGPAAVEEHAMVEEQVAAPVEEVADLPAGGEQAARAVCRRRAARDSALSEPGSSSGGVMELERE